MTAPAAARREEDPREAGARMIDLVAAKGHLAEILGSDPATVERFKTVVLSAITSSPKLLQADPATLVQAIREAAMWDLEPDGVDAVIVPYWNSKRSVYEADFQVTARGYVTVLYRSPRVLFVDADLIYEADHFEYEKGAVPRLVHRPAMFGDRGKRIGAYALVQLNTGFVRPIVLNEEAIGSRRKRSRDAEKGTWFEWPDEMARKTALRALMSLVPIERGVKAALAVEERKYPLLAPVAAVPALVAGPTQAAPTASIEAARAAFIGTAEPIGETQEADPIDGDFSEALSLALDAEAAKEGLLTAAPTAAPEPESQEVPGEVVNAPRSAGLTVGAFRELCRMGGKATRHIASALECVPADVGKRVEGMSDAERGALADELKLDWRIA